MRSASKEESGPRDLKKRAWSGAHDIVAREGLSTPTKVTHMSMMDHQIRGFRPVTAPARRTFPTFSFPIPTQSGLPVGGGADKSPNEALGGAGFA
jgi:hypothetical protein